MPALPIAASTATEALVALFVVLLAAKLGDEVCRRLRQPPIIGEILAGVLIGSSVLGLVEPGEVLETFSELGVVILLFVVGLETRLSEMRRVGGPALRVGLLGAVLPFVGGFALGEALGESLETSLFLASALMATSAGITSAVLLDLGVADRPGARTILGAAIVDDIVALVLLSVVVGVADGGGVSVSGVALLLIGAVAFIGVVAVGGVKLVGRRPSLLEAPSFAQTALLPAVLLCLGLAALAAEIGLAAIVGAFIAGMIVAEAKEHTAIEREIAPLYAFFPPFFFAFVGLQVDLGELADVDTLLTLAAVVALAVATKAAGAWLGARSLDRGDRAMVAVGMVPRGEVGIIVAGIGSAAGVIGDELFAVIVGMSVLTTLLAPPLLRRVA
ncbi:MAG: cation:proton antiporter [Thermoleophilaceae bacterium]